MSTVLSCFLQAPAEAESGFMHGPQQHLDALCALVEDHPGQARLL
ncbi:hypothetical protein [Hydrogenophaga sp. BPS33]|nr:hypothetical protein [Hydrogenophaga sp. BPS33]